MLPDFRILREAPGLKLRENRFTIDADLKAAAIGGNEN